MVAAVRVERVDVLAIIWSSCSEDSIEEEQGDWRGNRKRKRRSKVKSCMTVECWEHMQSSQRFHHRIRAL